MQAEEKRQVLDVFQRFAIREKFLETTRQDYLFYIHEYLDWFAGQKKPFVQSSLVDVNSFLDWKEQKRNKQHLPPLSLNTLNSVKASIRALYLANALPELAVKIRGKKAGYKIPVVLSLDAIKTVIQESRNFYVQAGSDLKNERVYFMVTLLYQSGCRIGELVRLTRSDFDFVDNTVKVGSKNVEYLRKLQPDWVKSFRRWLDFQGLKKNVFIGKKKDEPLSKRTAQWVITELCRRKLGKSYSAHKFRASCITHRLNAGEEFFSVSSNFHITVETTRNYMGASARSLSKMINPLDIIDKEKG